VSDWSADANNTSDWGWVHFHQGGRYDSTTKLYSFRHRDYSPTLQRWMQEDPLGYVDGMHLYQYATSSPINSLDPSGLQVVQIPLPDPFDWPYDESAFAWPSLKWVELKSNVEWVSGKPWKIGMVWDDNGRRADAVMKQLILVKVWAVDADVCRSNLEGKCGL
jgi:RHS repeat-associated protein